MAAIIGNAIRKGVTSKQIIQYLLKKFPQYAGKINNALAAGFTIDQVVKYLEGGKKALAQLQDEEVIGTTEYERTRGADVRKRENINKGAAALGAAALGSLAIPSMMNTGVNPQVLPALSNETKLLSQSPEINISPKQLPPPPIPQLPSPPESLQPGPSLGLQMQQQAQAPINNAMQPPPAAQMTQAAQAIPRDPMKNIALAKNLGVDVQIKNLIDGNLPSERIETALKSWLPKEKYAALQSAEGGIQGLIEDISTLPSFKLQPTIPNQQQQAPVEETQEIEPVKQEVKPIEKGFTVSTPHGVGEVKAISANKAIVEVDGKAQKIDVEELEQLPIPKKDLADLYDDLIEGIEEDIGEDVSRMVNWAGYDPKTNTLAFLPHVGALYTYDNISPEDAVLLTDILSVRKTSGSNFIGAWSKNTKSPIGAAMSKLIQRLQKERGGKGSEYGGKFEPVYSAHEPAVLASKEKKKKKK